MADPVALEALTPREAITFFRSKGYANQLSRFDYRDVWQEEHARQFVVAKAMQDDVLVAIREAIDQALVDGTTYRDFRDQLKPKLQSLGWWGKGIQRDPQTGELKEVQLGSLHRLRTIFHTNVSTAYAAGRWARLSGSTLLRYLEYRQIDRPTARDQHKPFDGIILPISHPLWRKIFPPNGWFCGCDVRPMTEGMIAREGKRVTTDDELAAMQTVEWTNPRTGQIENLLEGIDPSFASNPGHAWLETDDRHAATAEALPSTHRAHDRGFIKEMAAMALRDGRNNALFYDLNANPASPPLGIARQVEDENERPAFPEATNLAMADSSIDGVLIQGFPDLPAMSAADFLEFGEAGVSQLASVGADGSIMRAARLVDASDIPTREILDASGRVWSGLPQSGLGLTLEEQDVLASIILGRHFARLGLISFAEAPSGRVTDLLALSANQIESILTRL